MSVVCEPYQYLMGILCRLHGEKDYTNFQDSWIPLTYSIAIHGWIFNWGEIISVTLNKSLEKCKSNKFELAPSFYMYAYLIDCICALSNFRRCHGRKIVHSPFTFCLGIFG